MILSEPICVAPVGDRCGEGAVWHPEEEAVYWTDVNRFLIHRLQPSDGCVKTWFFEEPVTAMMLTDQDDVLAVAIGSRVMLWEPKQDRRRDHGFREPGWPAVRLNDARVDPRGSLWVGSMRNNVNADGSPGKDGGTDGVLYRIDPDGRVSEWKRGLGISNTVCWSPDRTRFYFGDTLRNEIWVYEYDPATGEISGERSFFKDFPRGLPDGSAIDSEGYLWNCRYGGGCIVRLAPDGTIDRVIEMPVRNITTCTFGGHNWKTLYITTAANGAPPSDRLAGGLFTLQSDVPGQADYRFRISESRLD